MGDEIRDLDDVEAQAWARAYVNVEYMSDAAEVADECVRLLRRRRRPAALRDDPQIAEMAVERERAAIATWLRNMSDLDQWATSAGILLDLAISIDRGEHDHG